MNKLDFSVHFINHIGTGLLFITASLIITMIIVKKHVYSVFDPLFFIFILSSMAYAVVFYLYYFGLISSYYFWSFIFTQAAFFFGFLLNKPIKKINYNTKNGIGKSMNTITVLYPIAIILFVSSQMIVYYVSGIPLFMESRLSTFEGGGGYGLLSRIIYVTEKISISIAVYRLFYMKMSFFKKNIDMAVIFFSILVAILSGSKAGILAVVFVIFLTTLYAKKFNNVENIEKRIYRFLYVFTGLTVPAAIATIYIQTGYERFGDIIIALLMRFVNTGDIFFMSLPGNVIAQLPAADGWIGLKALFTNFLAGLRIVSWHELPVNLGLQIFGFHHTVEIITGPNARHNIFGLFYFGPYISIFFSFIMGFMLSFIRNRLYRSLPSNQTCMVLYVLLTSSAIYLGQDPAGMAFNYFFSVLLLFPFLYIVSNIIFEGAKNSHYSRQNYLSKKVAYNTP